MSIAYSRWPKNFEEAYRKAGYWSDEPLTQMIEDQVESNPNSVAIIDGERQVTYLELDQMANTLAIYLDQQGVKRFDTALVQLPNCLEFYVTYFALLKLGVAAVNAFFHQQALEISAYVEQLAPSLLIVSPEHELFANQEFVSGLKTASTSIETILSLKACDYAVSMQDILYSADHKIIEKPSFDQASDADEVAFFQLSSGSTALSKLIPRTHNDYLYSVRKSVEVCGLDQDTRYLCALPIQHNFPMSSPGALGVFYAGATLIIAQSSEPTHCFELISKHQVNMTALVPPAVALWLDAAPEHQAKLKSLKLLQVGGASFAEAQARLVPQVLGCQLQQVFGMAEGLVNYTRLDEELNYTTQGRPMSEADEVRVVNQACQEVAVGQIGMLMTRGPYTFRGYFNSPEYNQSSFDAEGFYCSGDLVQQDALGNIKVVGRVNEQIKRGHETLALHEVENLLLKHEAISQAALVAVPDDELGEKSCAFLVLKNKDIKPLVIRKHLVSLGIGKDSLPDAFQFLSNMPLTPVGKIDKQALKTQALKAF